MAAWWSVFGLGILYFIAAIPAGAALGMNPWSAAVAAWAGYVAVTAVVLMAGTPVRNWICKKFRLSSVPDSRKLFWRVWDRFGLGGLSVLAPVLCGPYIAAILAVSLGSNPTRVFVWISAGVLPWCVLFAALSQWGFAPQ